MIWMLVLHFAFMYASNMACRVDATTENHDMIEYFGFLFGIFRWHVNLLLCKNFLLFVLPRCHHWLRLLTISTLQTTGQSSKSF